MKKLLTTNKPNKETIANQKAIQEVAIELLKENFMTAGWKVSSQIELIGYSREEKVELIVGDGYKVTIENTRLVSGA
ncbi:hypothetical protein [Bacillus wiedmannii]|uniref:hypothetical protein n=1 Tax=Bacillus wiedmannii TaxID=1890302 RepID=UPI000BF0C2D1|nr:hypothetical protein [Bacillus wiedmannii]PEN61656.1 hypothetical protein CN576_21740 [Bacillus wiedmannii]PHA62900.1 hypothetical protein COE75_16840 [Bacillus wiedmannii]